ncbi:sensor histidine kinase [Spiractinospora alimapuensis]|nr:sensor histidine kinase [Spiractinospora alimapuensis]
MPGPGPARELAIVGVSAVLVLVSGALGSIDAGGLAVHDYPLLLSGPALLLFRNRTPRAVLVGALLSLLVNSAVQPEVGPHVALPALVALFTAVNHGYRGFAAAAVLPTIGAAALAEVSQASGPSGDGLQELMLSVGWFVAAGILGEATRQHTAYVREVEGRAAEARRTQEEAALRRAGEERLRIARELHDSLTHAISIIKVQAGVAAHLTRKRGEEVPEALVAIQEASGDATRELRATLEVLRRPADDPDDRPGLGQLEALVERSRGAGVPATVTVRGGADAVSADTDRAAYRIVQEALTNVTRHANPTTVRVEVSYETDVVRVAVENDGPWLGAQPPTPGTGLRGMRERASALGGWVRAEPGPEGGFRVEAELPREAPVEAPT